MPVSLARVFTGLGALGAGLPSGYRKAAFQVGTAAAIYRNGNVYTGLETSDRNVALPMSFSTGRVAKAFAAPSQSLTSASSVSESTSSSSSSPLSSRPSKSATIQMSPAETLKAGAALVTGSPTDSDVVEPSSATTDTSTLPTGLAKTTNYYNIPAPMRRQILSAEDIPTTPFRPGGKKLYLPWYIVSLMKSPTLPATWAKFQVPLRFSKLDLRDYLWHMYNVHAVRIRSFVKQSSPKLRDGKRWFRPQSQKYMVIQMDEPFYWPEDPTDYSPWRKELYEGMDPARSVGKKDPSYLEVSKVSRISSDNLAMLEVQARRLREGKAKWTPSPATYANPAFVKRSKSGPTSST